MTKAVQNFYESNPYLEWERLTTPYQQIEFISTLRLIDKYFPTHGRICDIGGGPGRYTIELLKRKYKVTLFDLAPALLEIAKKNLKQLKLKPENIIQGDAAKDLVKFKDHAFDAGLLLGPLYHLIDKKKRLSVLRQLKRIIKPGGIALIAYLNSWGILKTGLTDFPQRFSDLKFIRGLLNEQCFPKSVRGDFNECYWTIPSKALEEVQSVNFEVISYAGCESFANGAQPMIEKMLNEHPDSYENLIAFAAETSE